MRPLISKKSFSCIIIGSAVMSYIIKYVIEKLGDPIENIVCGAAIMISITSLVFLFKLKKYIGEFYQFNLSSCIRQQNSLTAQFVSFSLSNLANIFYPPQFLQ